MKLRRILSIVLVLCLVLGSFTLAMAAPHKTLRKEGKKYSLDKRDNRSIVSDSRTKGLRESDKVRIIVELSDKPVIDYATQRGVAFNKLNEATVRDISENLHLNQMAVKNSIVEQEINMSYHQSFTNVLNGFSGTTTFAEAKIIEKMPQVKRVVVVNEYSRPIPEMTNSLDIVNARATWNDLGYDGEGMVVAIIDTGIDPSHKDMVLTNPDKATLTEAKVEALKDSNGFLGTWRTIKVPYGYNYMDNNQEILDLGPGATRHGMHVAGTVGSNGNEEQDGIKGVAPEVQLLAMKVFGNNPSMPSTYGDIIIRAIDDSVALGADVINMSLGSTASFVLPDDPEQIAITKAVENGVFMSLSSGNANKFASPFDPYASNPDVGVVGSPGLTAESIQVAASSNKLYLYENMVTVGDLEIIGYGKDNWEARGLSGDLELIAIGGTKLGEPADYQGIDVKDKVVLVSRGEHTFYDKTEWAAAEGAAGIIVYDHELSQFYKNQGGWSIPFMKIHKQDGLDLEELLKDGPITINVSFNLEYLDPATGSITDFSSWGTTPNLDFKPDITAPGGNIYSTDQNDGYQYMSGTSMAAPHVSGGAALVLQAVKDRFPTLEGREKIEMAKNLIMSTAKQVEERFEYTSPRRQGAGGMDLFEAITTQTIITDGTNGHNTFGLSKVALKEIDNVTTFTLTVENFSDETVTYAVYGTVATDLAVGGDNWGEPQPVVCLVDEDGNIISHDEYDESEDYDEIVPISFSQEDDTVIDNVYNFVEVPGNATASFDVRVDLVDAFDWAFWKKLSEIFPNGNFIEGFIQLKDINDDDDDVDLSIPYVGFYGEWDKAPIIDESVYNMDESYYGITGMLDVNLNYLGEVGLDEFDESKIAISPNDDGIQDITLPVLSFLRNTEELDINILDEDENKIRDLVTEEYVRKDYFDGGDGSMYKIHDIWTWDGIANNKIVEDGQYYYEIRTKIHYPGAEWQSYKFPVYVDTIEPVVNGYNYDSDECILTINASDEGIGLSSYSLFQNDEVILSNSIGEFDLSDMVDGPLTFNLVVVDFAGNEYSQKIGVEDSTIPYVMIDTPEYLEVYNSNDIEIKGSIVDATGLKYLKINDEEVSFTLNEETGDFEFITILTFEDGIAIIDVTAEDNADNLINFEHKIFVDSTNPTIEMIEEPTEKIVDHNVENVAVAANISDNFGELRVKVNGNEVYYVADDWEYMTEVEPVSYTLENYDVKLEYGNNIITVEAYDAAGNSTINEYHVYRLKEGEEPGNGEMLQINEVNVTPMDEISSERPVTITATANQEANWEVKIINPDEEVETTLTHTGETFETTWAPQQAKKLNGEYKVEIKASIDAEVVIEEATFEVYNYPIKVKEIDVIKNDGYVAIEASMVNLGPDEESPMLVIQVTDDNNRVVNISTAKMEGLLAGQTVNLSSGFGVDEIGTYTVDVYVWTGWHDTKSLSISHVITFEIE